MGLWDALLDAPDEAWLDLLASADDEPEDWRALARRGGFPTPAIGQKRSEDRAVWFDGYIRTYLERDLQDIASISALPDFRRLMRAASLRLGQLVNQAELGRDVALSQPTVHRWLNLLELSYVLVRLPAFAVNRTKRLIKSPKLYWADEVDFVVESGGKLLPIEVKSGSRPRLADAANLRSFRAEYGRKSRAGLLLHTGTTTEWLAPGVLATPWWKAL